MPATFTYRKQNYLHVEIGSQPDHLVFGVPGNGSYSMVSLEERSVSSEDSDLISRSKFQPHQQHFSLIIKIILARNFNLHFCIFEFLIFYAGKHFIDQ